MATALDVIGDRWTILVLRELLGGPARFQDLHEGLPGIAKNLLTDRLRRLEGDGILRRVRSQGAVLYSLTELGMDARTALEQLAFWGAKLQPIAPPEHPRSARAIAMALHALLSNSEEARLDRRRVVELEMEDDERIRIVLGPHPSATVVSSFDVDARVGVPRSAIAGFLQGRTPEAERFVLLSGDDDARRAVLHALGIDA